jgi:zinc protease
VFSGPFRWSAAERVTLRALGMVLEGQLGASLREEQSGTYGVKVSPVAQRVPNPEYLVSIDFACAPERTESLVKSLFDEIARLRIDGPSAGHVSDVREALLREHETNVRDNVYLADQIVQRYEEGADVRSLTETPALYAALSAAALRDAARTYLDTKNYVRVTLVPGKAR